MDPDDARSLMDTLKLDSYNGAIAIGAQEWHVFIWEKVKKPPLIKWKGFPVVYHIGGGMPQALGFTK